MDHLAHRNKWQSHSSLITYSLFLLKFSIASRSSAINEASAVSHSYHTCLTIIILETKYLCCCEIKVCGAALGIPCFAFLSSPHRVYPWGMPGSVPCSQVGSNLPSALHIDTPTVFICLPCESLFNASWI